MFEDCLSEDVLLEYLEMLGFELPKRWRPKYLEVEERRTLAFFLEDEMVIMQDEMVKLIKRWIILKRPQSQE